MLIFLRANILTIVRMLKCFFLASGLQINILKSKLMALGSLNEEASWAANIYLVFYLFPRPFLLSVSELGCRPSRRNRLGGDNCKLSTNYQNGKLSTLSVGGRLTLITSDPYVLASLYHYVAYNKCTPWSVLSDLGIPRQQIFLKVPEYK
ncbi:hypothetical protein Tco_1134970 [Tanacetum coccineum]